MARTVGKHEAAPKKQKEEFSPEVIDDWTPSSVVVDAEPEPEPRKSRRTRAAREKEAEPQTGTGELDWEPGWEPESERARKAQPGWLKAIKTVAILLVVFAVLLLVADVVQRGSFAAGTDINGIDVGRMSASHASQTVSDALQLDTVITLTDPQGNTVGQLRLADLLRSGDLNADVEKLVKSQHEKFLPLAFFGQGADSYSLNWLNRDSIEALLTGAVGSYGQSEATPARLTQGENGWELIPAKNGTAPDLSAAATQIANALSGNALANTANLSVSVPLKETVAPLTAEDETARAQIEAIQSATAKSVFIDFGADLVVELGPAQLSSAYKVELTDTGADVTLDSEALTALLDRVIEENKADGIDRKYRTIDRAGAELHYNDWDTGFTLKRETLRKDVETALKGDGGNVTAQYVYVTPVKKHFANNNNSFIEINLENQYLWFYRRGDLVLSTPIVSGSVANGTETPKGAYSVSYKQKNAKLAGPGYSYTVDYWIPFYGNIGIHDAKWQDSYGGDIYLTEDGSHGCVEVPEDIIEAIYENASTYIPVFVY